MWKVREIGNNIEISTMLVLYVSFFSLFISFRRCLNDWMNLWQMENWRAKIYRRKEWRSKKFLVSLNTHRDFTIAIAYQSGAFSNMYTHELWEKRESLQHTILSLGDHSVEAVKPFQHGFYSICIYIHILYIYAALSYLRGRE